MKKRELLLTMIIGIVCSGPILVEASETLPEIRDQRLDLKQDVMKKEADIEAMGEAEQKYLTELKALDDEAALVNEKIRNLHTVVELSDQTAEMMKKEIEELNARIVNREKLIKERLRTMQIQDGLGLYVDIIFDSKNLSQLFDAAKAISTIMKADKDLIAKHQADLLIMKEKEKDLQKRIVSLENDQKEMQSLKAELQEKADEKQRLLDSVQKERKESESELMDMYEVYVNLASQEIAILKENQEQRVEYLTANPEDVFIMPAAGELTSEYGPRWGRLHAGIDIADESPDAIVVAAASGTVIRSYYSATYGNCVLITHKIDGMTFTTLYAHLEKSTVTTGQSISKGEMLGFMGNTGDSRGKHLHFEIHEGQWNYEKSNSVDPLKYLEK
ncbi:peptidoglycan DD-metalloendopeptidase family protein [Mesobacillus subterraneus]|uniref:murein hydrolase activator EnvC family protein n=1 Tax=Mesobacillus subterraneus TaxID=285983 RepID=UPI00203DF19A|nr:peptidoglycan DD-metalloendopeptidase family protein [Mesobacillus subterraneus]MCM3665210.1 peptidoglycan DD-metalloendopeptidase family protein [Mesobacillus subterraneus]MCM3684223.1 peptidoglycan DD-metalloendopeptidase family protein [Mesobacillus subterraneus]